MNRWVNLLLLLLTLQVTVLMINYESQKTQVATRSIVAPLTPVDPALVDEIRIGDEHDNEVVLQRTGNVWLLPEEDGLPADKSAIDALLSTFTEPLNEWPVANSSAARQRFQVADYYYQRRVTLTSSGKEMATVYLGTAPGFRKVHARRSDSENIYSINFNTFDAAAVAGAWLEPRLLQIRTPTRIDADTYNLSFENGHWRSGTGGTPDPEELNILLAALRSIRVDGIASQDLQRELAEAEAELELTVYSLAGETSLALFALEDAYFIYSSEYALFFKLASTEFYSLTSIDVTKISGEPRKP